MVHEKKLPEHNLRVVSDQVMYTFEEKAEKYYQEMKGLEEKLKKQQRGFSSEEPVVFPPARSIKQIAWEILQKFASMSDPRYINHLFKRAYEKLLKEKVASAENKVKSFTRIAGLYAPPLEQTAYCPDHSHIRLGRVPGLDRVFVCPLDGKRYDFKRGFEKYDGEFVPGSSVEFQIPDWMGNRY